MFFDILGPSGGPWAPFGSHGAPSAACGARAVLVTIMIAAHKCYDDDKAGVDITVQRRF